MLGGGVLATLEAFGRADSGGGLILVSKRLPAFDKSSHTVVGRMGFF